MRLLFGKDVPAAFLDAFKSCREHFIMVALLSCLINILYLSPTIYMIQVYDRVVPTSGLMTLLYITLAVTFALVTLSALDAVRARILVRASLRVEKSLGRSIVARMLQNPASSGHATQAMREFDAVRQVVGGPPAMIFFDAPWVPIYIIVAAILHPAIAGIIIVAGILLVVLTVTNERKTRDSTLNAHKQSAIAYADLERTSTRSEVVRALGMKEAMIERHMEERAKGVVEGSEGQLVATTFTSTGKFLRMWMQSMALGLGAWLAVERQISIGAVIAASVLLSRALQPIEQLISAWPSIGRGRAAMDTLRKFFEGTKDEDAARTSLPAPLGELQAEGIYVRAGAQGPIILNNVNFRITPGQFVGVIGPSGAGKSTLARVIANAIAPDMGKVRMDGADYNDWPSDLLASYIGYLPQDYGLLSGTITENISRFSRWTGGVKEEIDERVIAAAKQAGAHDIILKLPKGYDTILSASGGGLSAGQSQRVALARALYGNPRLIIMDEPDSALDTDGEIALTAAIHHAKQGGATLVVISHRQKILATADRLIVMQGGGVRMDGPRDEVMAKLAPKPNAGHVVSIGTKK